MRPTILRTGIIEVDGETTILQADLNGLSPVTLYLENEDTFAFLNMKWGSKNGNIKFTAADAGDGGNDFSVEITAAADQEFSIDVNSNYPYDGDSIVINLACDADGVPTMTADDVIDAVNADPYAGADVVASRANGSDGSARCNTMEATNLAGGYDSETLGTVHVYHGPTVDGPWDESTAASAAFNTQAADTTKAFTIDSPVRGLKITADDGGQAAHVRVTLVRTVNQ